MSKPRLLDLFCGAGGVSEQPERWEADLIAVRLALMHSMAVTDGEAYTHDDYDRGMAALDRVARRLAAAERDRERLREALADVLAQPRWVSIGSIANTAELQRISRNKWNRLSALAASAAPEEESVGEAERGE